MAIIKIKKLRFDVQKLRLAVFYLRLNYSQKISLYDILKLNLALRRVLVLIQVASATPRRDKHTPKIKEKRNG